MIRFIDVNCRIGTGPADPAGSVRTKEALLALMDDAMMAELIIPESEMPEGWRERLTMPRIIDSSPARKARRGRSAS